MELNKIQSVYFIGAGGIGMSALVRYFLSLGKQVGGYDRVETELTRALTAEGAMLHYEDSAELIPACCIDSTKTLVVLTPAIPASHTELQLFQQANFTILKRAEVLGLITQASKGLCVAGTHGKTTTSGITAHLLHQSHIGCTAFLGGILKNYQSNLLLSETSPFTVIEADEYDRSFHTLSPYMSVITSTDPDHLDIYGTEEAYLESFATFTSLIQPGGALILRKGVSLKPIVQKGVTTYLYGRDEGDFHAANIKIGGGEITFDFVTPTTVIPNIQLGVPISINIENGVAAMALAWLNGVTTEELQCGMASFKGIDRRFDFRIKQPNMVYINDYAHHPEELKQSIGSIKALYEGKRVTGVFQPHLYSRTADFYAEFADALSLLDDVILLDIYPARELPIPGITSKLIFDQIPAGVSKTLCTKSELMNLLASKKIEVLVTLGAGDIDDFVLPIEQMLHANL